MIRLLKNNISFFLMILGLFAFRWSLADQYKVPTGSMEPTIAVGDRVLVNKMAYDLKIPFTSTTIASFGNPERGDVIVFDNPQNQICMVKRLVGLPGDMIVIRDGFVSINGEWLKGDQQAALDFESSMNPEFFYREGIGHRHAEIKRIRELFVPQDMQFTVPEGKYFVMGDNRDNSADSRSWGFLHREDIKGRAWGVFYNLSFKEHLVPEISRIGHLFERSENGKSSSDLF